MSVLIRGMKMPASCYDCDLCFESMDSERNVYWTCPVLNMDVEKYERMEDCPLVEVPEPHGRLIDADKLLRYINCMMGSQAFAKTVIDAEGNVE